MQAGFQVLHVLLSVVSRIIAFSSITDCHHSQNCPVMITNDVNIGTAYFMAVFHWPLLYSFTYYVHTIFTHSYSNPSQISWWTPPTCCFWIIPHLFCTPQCDLSSQNWWFYWAHIWSGSTMSRYKQHRCWSMHLCWRLHCRSLGMCVRCSEDKRWERVASYMSCHRKHSQCCAHHH